QKEIKVSISNNDILTVSQISNRIKNSLEDNFHNMIIRGEISGLKIASSMHAYFSLKEGNHIISSICWKGIALKYKEFLKEGLNIRIRGNITCYSGQSKYQLIVTSISPDGEGVYSKLLRERKDRLEREGLFNAKYKRKIPLIPHKIGIITSKTGSVIKDIIHRVKDRFPTNIILYPISVQGENCPAGVIEGIKYFNIKESEKERVDIIIIARGGGSIEDLWGFNDEEVAREVFKSTIPIISAIGHETDYTILDFVADIRAPTPTAAAEIATPVKSSIEEQINKYQYILLTNYKKYLINQYQNLKIFAMQIRRLPDVVNYMIQKYDHNETLLVNKIDSYITKVEKRLESKCINYKIVNNIIRMKQDHLDYKSNIFNTGISNFLTETQLRFDKISIKINNLDYQKVINMGYSIIKINDKYISSKQEIDNFCDEKDDINLSIIMKDGEMDAILVKNK
ncbi:MAG TPA: exodeoxyribonuclease VII large subunit, partial [Candidatus Megaira endosymbiont of Hartmannula sinica]|nr:exodeoxyribonuclease VII large subunit [Candidatus Megaera endosymbiont of Hartmannula sinica]